MKLIFKNMMPAGVSLILIFILGACSKDSKDTKDNVLGNYSFEYTVDGQKFSWSGYPGNNQCIYLETGPYSSASMLPTSVSGIIISAESIMNVGTKVFDNNSGFSEGVVLSGNNGGTSRAAGGSVTVNISEKGIGKNSHVKGTFSGTIININTQKPMTISGTFDLCNITP